MRLKLFLLVNLWLALAGLSEAQFLSPLPKSLTKADIDTLKQAGKKRKWLLRPAFLHRSDAVYRLYGGKGAISYLGSFSGAISKKRAFIVNELLSGIGGKMRVSLSSAFVVTKSNAGDSAKAEIEEDKNAAVTRLIANGGSFSVKIGHPFWAGGGGTWQQASFAYLNFGLLTGLTDVESENHIGAFGLIGEYIGSYAIRSPETQEVGFEILLGVRGGFNRATKKFLGFKSRSIPFVQVAAGIRQSKELKYTLLYTIVRDEFSQFTPKVILNLQATAF